MATLEPELPEDDLPKCGICGNPMVRLKQATQNRKTPIYVCNKGKDTFRMPCDGFAFEIALKNT